MSKLTTHASACLHDISFLFWGGTLGMTQLAVAVVSESKSLRADTLSFLRPFIDDKSRLRVEKRVPPSAMFGQHRRTSNAVPRIRTACDEFDYTHTLSQPLPLCDSASPIIYTHPHVCQWGQVIGRLGLSDVGGSRLHFCRKNKSKVNTG